MFATDVKTQNPLKALSQTNACTTPMYLSVFLFLFLLRTQNSREQEVLANLKEV